jgi:pyruvate/2-oxoglutarate/acetoin dehydrogenase E1 component
MTLVMDSLVNQAAKYWSLSNGQRSVPMVVRTTVGAGGRFGAIHSQNPANWLMSVPGLKLVAPAFPKDAGGLLVSSIRDDDPVLFLEHKRLYSVKGERSIEPAPLGKASIVKEGGDLTLVSVMVGVHHGLAAAESLREEGIGVEVVDLRTLRPWDVDTVLASVDKTKRLVVVDEGPRTGGWPADVLATVAEADLSGIVTMRRVTAPDEPLPYSPPLEDAFLPNPTTIAEAVREALGAEARSAR